MMYSYHAMSASPSLLSQLDLGSFLTLTESDLIDLCITSQPDRQRLLALIRKLQSGGRASPSVEQNGSQPSPGGCGLCSTLTRWLLSDHL